MKRRGKQHQSKDEAEEVRSLAEDSSKANKAASHKQKRFAEHAYETMQRFGERAYRCCGCAWWQCLLAWGSVGLLLFGVRTTPSRPEQTYAVQQQN